MDRFDFAAAIGAIILAAGIWMIHQPSALIAAGAMLIVGSLVFAPPNKPGHTPDPE